MDIRRIVVLLVTFVLVFASLACADELDQRFARAYEQIEANVRSGSMTRLEAQKLKDELRDIREAERKRLNHELDRLEMRIFRDKTNDHRRFEDRGRDDDRGSFGKIVVISGTYGGNRGVPKGNVTSHIAAQCNGHRRCDYAVDYKVIGDPTPNLIKDYVAEWRCGRGPIQTVSVPAEAGYRSIVTLSCE